MENYNREKFEDYLKTKLAESTAKMYATDMAVCVKALEKIKLYENKELTEILEDFVSHKKAIKNYLQEEFLKALIEVGSNDSGLYDGIVSKAKHYLTMLKNEDNNLQYSEEISSDKDDLNYLYDGLVEISDYYYKHFDNIDNSGIMIDFIREYIIDHNYEISSALNGKFEDELKDGDMEYSEVIDEIPNLKITITKKQADFILEKTRKLCKTIMRHLDKERRWPSDLNEAMLYDDLLEDEEESSVDERLDNAGFDSLRDYIEECDWGDEEWVENYLKEYA